MMDTKSNSMIYLPLDKLLGTNGANNPPDSKVQSGTLSQDGLPTVEIRGNKDAGQRDAREREVR